MQSLRPWDRDASLSWLQPITERRGIRGKKCSLTWAMWTQIGHVSLQQHAYPVAATATATPTHVVGRAVGGPSRPIGMGAERACRRWPS
jgi:hypothetical protein